MEKAPAALIGFIAHYANLRMKAKPPAQLYQLQPVYTGHRYLVEYSAMRCELLYIFVVSEDKSTFPFDIRRARQAGVADLPNVRCMPVGTI